MLAQLFGLLAAESGVGKEECLGLIGIIVHIRAPGPRLMSSDMALDLFPIQEDLRHAEGAPDPYCLAHILCRDGVIALVKDHVMIGMDYASFPERGLEAPCGEWNQGSLFVPLKTENRFFMGGAVLFHAYGGKRPGECFLVGIGQVSILPPGD